MEQPDEAVGCFIRAKMGALTIGPFMTDIELTWQDYLMGCTVEWGDANGFILSKGADLFTATKLDGHLNITLLATLPLGVVSKMALRIRPAQRLLRQFYYNVLRLPTGDILTVFDKKVTLLREGRWVPVTGFYRPARFLRGSCAVDVRGGVYMGEYFANPERKSVRIYYLAPGSTRVESVYEFKAGSVRHVHGIYIDPHDHSLWCTTGDVNRECSIQRTTDGFRTLDVIGSGDETWRAVGLSITERYVFYGTDAEFRENCIFCLDKRTGKRITLGAVDGPVYYTTEVGGYHFFGVSAEGASSQYENVASLWCVDPADSLRKILSYKKDWFPMLFMYGSLHFMLKSTLTEKNDQHTYIYFHGLAGVDQKTMKISLPPRAETDTNIGLQS